VFISGRVGRHAFAIGGSEFLLTKLQFLIWYSGFHGALGDLLSKTSSEFLGDGHNLGGFSVEDAGTLLSPSLMFFHRKVVCV
jgi:hypothetical protein